MLFRSRSVILIAVVCVLIGVQVAQGWNSVGSRSPFQSLQQQPFDLSEAEEQYDFWNEEPHSPEFIEIEGLIRRASQHEVSTCQEVCPCKCSCTSRCQCPCKKTCAQFYKRVGCMRPSRAIFTGRSATSVRCTKNTDCAKACCEKPTEEFTCSDWRKSSKCKSTHENKPNTDKDICHPEKCHDVCCKPKREPSKIPTCKEYWNKKKCPDFHNQIMENVNKTCTNETCTKICCKPKTCVEYWKQEDCGKGFKQLKEAALETCTSKQTCQDKCCITHETCQMFQRNNGCTKPLKPIEDPEVLQQECRGAKDCLKKCCEGETRCVQWWETNKCPDKTQKEAKAEQMVCKPDVKGDCEDKCCSPVEDDTCAQFWETKGCGDKAKNENSQHQRCKAEDCPVVCCQEHRDCKKFWESPGCPPETHHKNLKNEKSKCKEDSECKKQCCLPFKCEDFWRRRKCPAENPDPIHKNKDLECGTDEQCGKDCCTKPPYKCYDFWKEEGCPRTHKNKKPFETVKNLPCDKESGDCALKCCDQSVETCEDFYKIHGCPPDSMEYESALKRNTKCTGKFADKNCHHLCCWAAQCGKGKCCLWGDPHVITFDNAQYTCWEAGEFTVLSVPRFEETVTAETTRQPGAKNAKFPSYVTGIATNFSNSFFSIQVKSPQWKAMNLVLRCNGEEIAYPKEPTECGSRIVLIPVGGIPQPNWARQKFDPKIAPSLAIRNVVTRTTVIVKYRFNIYGMRFLHTFVTQGGQKGEYATFTSGLCGNWDGKASNDIVGSNALTCTQKTANNCCFSWRVQPSKSLFLHPPKADLVPVKPMSEEQQMLNACGNKGKVDEATKACKGKAKALLTACVIEICMDASHGKSVSQVKADVLKDATDMKNGGV